MSAKRKLYEVQNNVYSYTRLKRWQNRIVIILNYFYIEGYFILNLIIEHIYICVYMRTYILYISSESRKVQTVKWSEKNILKYWRNVANIRRLEVSLNTTTSDHTKGLIIKKTSHYFKNINYSKISKNRLM